MKILFLSRWYPYPPNNGSKLRIYNLIRGLAQSHEITLISFIEPNDGNKIEPEIQSFCQDIHVIPWKPYNPYGWRARLGYLSSKPRSVIDTYSQEMEKRIVQVLTGGDFDLVIASQVDMAAYSHIFRDYPAMFEEVELGVGYDRYSLADSRLSQIWNGLGWKKQRRYISRLISDFRICTVVSEREKQLLIITTHTTKPVEIIPNVIDLSDYIGVDEAPQPNELIFTGSFRYSANYDAMVWFVREVFPRIQSQIPDVHLTITGYHDDLPLPSANNVSLKGFVDDIRPLVASAWISIAPIRLGGGTRLKILEAMALGTPVVATPKGAEGLDVKNGEHILIAETPESYSQEVIRLLSDPDLRERLADNALQLIREKYDYSAIMPKFTNLVNLAVQKTPMKL